MPRPFYEPEHCDIRFALGERRHRGLARRLVVSARAYVGFVRANVAKYDITEVCHRSRGRPVIRCPILA